MAPAATQRGQFGLEPCIMLLKRSQAANVGPIGCADEMREHVHLAEHPMHQAFAGERVRQHRPVDPRNRARGERFLPPPFDVALALRRCERPDGRGMSPVQRLVQEPAGSIVVLGEPDGEAVEAVVRCDRDRESFPASDKYNEGRPPPNEDAPAVAPSARRIFQPSCA
jgi:hypothetical protein